MKKLSLFLGLALLSSCATDKPVGPRGSFSVKTVPFFGNDVHVFIQVFDRTNGQRGPLLSSRRVNGDGVTGFVLPMGKTYSVHAYADLDHDGKQGPAEPSANLDGLQPVADVNAQQAPAILTLPGAGVAPDWPGKKSDGDNTTPASREALMQKAADKVQEVAPGLPVPPPPSLPVPPPPR